jgi:hypothetical protein
MTRQTHGLAAKTGLIEALQPAGYEFETGETDSGVAMLCAALSASEHDQEKWCRFSEKIMLKQKIERDDDSKKRHAARVTQIEKRARRRCPRMSAFREQ